MIRASDGIILVFDLTQNPVQQFRRLISTLEEIRISTQKQVSRVEIIRGKGSVEIRIAGSGIQLLHSNGLRNALVRIYGNVSIDGVEDGILENVTVYKPTFIVANKLDVPDARRVSADFLGQMPKSSAVVLTSCLTGEGLTKIGEEIFLCLGLIRVYTNEPSQSRPSEPPSLFQAGQRSSNLHAAFTRI